MVVKIKNIDINYTQYGSGKRNIVLLHGWGQNIEMMNPIGTKLEKDATITVIDLPGHGKSEEPKEAITIYDYCDVVKELLDKLKIKKPILIGHSFGGRISIIYASLYDTEKLILLGAPCIRKNTKVSLKVKMLKTLKKVPGLNKMEGFAKKHIGSRDYKNASETMRKILVNTVNEDLTECAKKIKCPTLLIWGTNDQAVPYSDGQELEKLIKDCGLVTYENCTHYAYLERLGQTVNVLNSFIGDDK